MEWAEYELKRQNDILKKCCLTCLKNKDMFPPDDWKTTHIPDKTWPSLITLKSETHTYGAMPQTSLDTQREFSIWPGITVLFSYDLTDQT